MKGKFTKEFIEGQRLVMAAYEKACLVSAKKLKKQALFDYNNGQYAATDNYVDALDEIERLQRRVTELQLIDMRTTVYLEKLGNQLMNVVTPALRGVL